MEPLPFVRSRLDTPDGDSILIDTLLASPAPASTVAVLSHGLKGDSRRKYIRGICRVFTARGWDYVSKKFRVCGGGDSTACPACTTAVRRTIFIRWWNM